MPLNPSELVVNGHTYVARFRNVPCPLPGREDCIVATKQEGLPAYWQDGVLYLLRDWNSNLTPREREFLARVRAIGS